MRSLCIEGSKELRANAKNWNLVVHKCIAHSTGMRGKLAEARGELVVGCRLGLGCEESMD